MSRTIIFLSTHKHSNSTRLRLGLVDICGDIHEGKESKEKMEKGKSFLILKLNSLKKKKKKKIIRDEKKNKPLYQ